MWKMVAFLLAIAAANSAVGAAPYFHWYVAAADTKPRPWAILFPRAMGVGKLVKGNQYVDFAHFLNALGIDVVLIDDDAAMAALKPKGSTGEKLSALANNALEEARKLGRMDMRCPGIAVGWSRGGEGALQLASSAEGGKTGVTAAIVYYPSVRGQPKPWQQMHPVLALQGNRDSLAPHTALEALVAGRTPKDIAFKVNIFAGSKHRFDVARSGDQSSDSAKPPKEYDPQSKIASLEAVRGFLAENNIATSGCALD